MDLIIIRLNYLRIFFLIISFILIASITEAQDTTVYQKKGLISTLRKKLKATRKRINQPVAGVNKTISSSTDTLKQVMTGPLAPNLTTDSLQQLSKVNESAFPVDTISVIPNLIEKLNSTALNGPLKIDSLERKVNSSTEGVNDRVSSLGQSAEKKVNELNGDLNKKTDQLEDKLQEGFKNATDNEVKAPLDLNVQNTDLKLPETNAEVNMPDANLPGVNAGIPEVELPSNFTESLELPDTDVSVDQLKEKVAVKIPEADKIKDVSGEIDKADGKLAEAEKYEEELKQIKQGDLSSTENLSQKAEQKVAGISDVKDLSEQADKLTKQQAEYQALIQKYRDKKLIQEEVLRKTKNIANDKLNKFSPAVKEAQEQIAKAQKLNSNVKSFKTFFKKRPNEMKNKPFYERLVPGITLQVYNADIFKMDFATQLGFKISGRLLLGAGGIYRFGFSKDFDNWVKGLDVYGFRVYSDFTLLKGIYAHGEFESLYMKSYVQPVSQIETNNLQGYNGYFGLGRRYNISKKLKGTVVALYRVEFKGDLPYTSKIGLRVGFDYNTKKRKNSTIAR